MIQLIKKGGLRERANRSSKFKGSENTETALSPHRYAEKSKQVDSIKPKPQGEQQK